MSTRRHDAGDVMRLLEGRLPAMAEILEHTRQKGAMGTPKTLDGRKVRECVAVMLVEEPDGSETVLIVGDADAGDLQLKGVLHDALYAFAHKGEPGYTVKEHAAVT